jgi:2-keto-3-deoxy-L-fuconate dehydrogenase
MPGKLNGKTAFITAAGQGIGRATAELFAAEAATVWATDIDGRLLSALEAKGCKARVLDVTDGRAVDDAARESGAIDILFNCAGYVANGTILDCTNEEWDRSFDINVKSMYRTIRAFLPKMLERGGGSIINMSSVAGATKGAPNRFVYGATKAAVVGLTKAVAADYVTRGIRCNAICPGTVQTPSLDGRIAAAGVLIPGGTEAARQAFIDRQPLGRLGTAEEIAALAVYLASDESRFTTGTTQVIDGGWSL